MYFQYGDLMRLLYEGLTEACRNTCILTDREVDDVQVNPNNVRVRCKGGSSYEGSILIGADGVDSAVRSYLAKALSNEQLASPFVTSYRVLYGQSKWTKGLDPGTMYEMHGEGIAIQIIPAGETTMFSLFHHLPKSRSGSFQCTADETATFVYEALDAHVSETVEFGDLWEKTKWKWAADLKEGMASKWHGDRVVLAGDAVNKTIPVSSFTESAASVFFLAAS